MSNATAAPPPRIYVIGTFDTKATEICWLASRIRAIGGPTLTVDVSTTPGNPRADVSAEHVAGHHPQGAAAVFTDDRATATPAMAVALQRWLLSRDDVGAVIGLGGSGGTALVTPAMRALPVGLPKVMVSTVAARNAASYVGPTDIAMMYSVTDVAGINRVSRRVLANAAGMIVGGFTQAQHYVDPPDARPAIGLSMFGVTTPCVQAISARLRYAYDCVVFHATGTGGQSMEKLVDSGLLHGLIDLTTTEVCDYLFGGVLPCTEDRFGAIARTGVPYVGACGALDMINFGRPETVPAEHRDRLFYPHTPNVTLMRTTPQENAEMGRWIGERLNRCEGEVRFLIPQGGVSALDAPGRPFHAPAADRALFDALADTIRQTARRRLVLVPHHINDPAFAAIAVRHFEAIGRMAPFG